MNPVENGVPSKPLFVLRVFHRSPGAEHLEILSVNMAVPIEGVTSAISSRVRFRPGLSTGGG